ncbi:MAG: ribulose-phosphate 3-epimerase, partial [Anaerolineales bacterium]|nr:ribulose-phosphate 3-epimerase [Anaerolineales bacterium]
MKQQYVIAPSILSADFLNLGEQISECEAAGADWIHVDVMDGHFVPNISVGPFIVEACRRATKLPLDVHLMIKEPERYLQAFFEAGAGRLSVQVETCPHLYRTLQQIKDLGCLPGVVINPGTPSIVIEPVLHLVDLVLVMTVNPGFSDQVFLPDMTSKITEIRKKLDSLKSTAWLEVDGGISSTTLPSVLAAGATAFVAASAVFKHPAG